MKRILGLTVVAIVASLCMGYYLLTRPSVHSRVPFLKQLIAEYDGFAFVSVEDEMNRFVTGLIEGGSQMPVAKVFVRAEQHGTLLLSELTEELAREIVLAAGWHADPPADNTQIFYWSESMLEFQNHTLTYAYLFGEECPFELAPSHDGPFVRLPVSRQEMLDVFRKPKRWYFANRLGGP